MERIIFDRSEVTRAADDGAIQIRLLLTVSPQLNGEAVATLLCWPNAARTLAGQILAEAP